MYTFRQSESVSDPPEPTSDSLLSLSTYIALTDRAGLAGIWVARGVICCQNGLDPTEA